MIYPDYINWVLMILLMLNTRCRDDLDFMWIENVTLLSYDLDYSWISLILRMFHSLFVISVFVVLFDLEDIFSTSWMVLDYYSYSVIEIELLFEWFHWYIGIHIIYSEFDNSYYLISVIGDVEDYNRLIAMWELINYLLDWWFTISNFLSRT